MTGNGVFKKTKSDNVGGAGNNEEEVFWSSQQLSENMEELGEFERAKSSKNTYYDIILPQLIAQIKSSL